MNRLHNHGFFHLCDTFYIKRERSTRLSPQRDLRERVERKPAENRAAKVVSDFQAFVDVLKGAEHLSREDDSQVFLSFLFGVI